MRRALWMPLAGLGLLLLPALAGAELVAALNFTNNAAAWTTFVLDAGYAYTLELDGDPTKYGYEENTNDTGAVMFYQAVAAPEGFTMSDIRLEAKISGFSSWTMVSRFGFGLSNAFGTVYQPYWTGIDHTSGVVVVDLPMSVDASGDPLFTGVTGVVVQTEVHKGLAGVYVRPDVSSIRLYATLTSTSPPSELAEFTHVEVNDMIGMSFTGEVGKLYLLQYTQDLVSTNWLDTEVFVRGTGAESLIFDPAGLSTQKNYRIVEALP